MPFLDLPIDQLRTFRPEVALPDDFDDFWSRTLEESRAAAIAPTLTRIDSVVSSFDIFDVSFSGFAGDPVSGWFIVPAGSDGPLPTIVEYLGYGAGRGLPHERLAWPSCGYAYFLMDTRGQGSGGGTGGCTPDPHGSGPSGTGFVTRGIEDPLTYFYRRVYTDAALAIDAVRSFDLVDGSRIAVCGGSQGGGIAIAAAALADGVVAAMPEVPFLCNFERGVGLTERSPYNEVARYLSVHRDAAPGTFATLSYFDGANFATRATMPAHVGVALMDPVCPPSTVFATANRWGGGADIVEYPYNEHESGQGFHWQRQVAWLKALGV
ncbi:acetylxylan esterase [Labedella endophytica]|uniref:Acetylxylan esterase n=1 Tax=Labedella endophytica TaxID=1523160 RepID=A0A433JWY0_9MICO|nr:acetylxylan esterase [Labedella endophytica]RUR03498.1 acetylxylan esterase [Labedella endophytica]